MMLHSIKNFGNYPHTWFLRSLSSNLGRESASTLRFCTHPDNALDKTQKSSQKAAEDVMSKSFEEEYATRSDEKGFEGVAKSKIEMDKFIHENHPAYDKTQVNEMKEKEKARH